MKIIERAVNRFGWWLQGAPTWGTYWGMKRVEARGKTRRHPDGFIFRERLYRFAGRLNDWEAHGWNRFWHDVWLSVTGRWKTQR